MIDTYVGYREVPHYSQKREFLLKEGSLNLAQIDEWENNLCGLMCSLMVLNAFSIGSEHTVAELLSLTSRLGAFDQRRGWRHKKIVSLLRKYGINGKCRSVDDLDVMYELLNRKNLIIASVAPNYPAPEGHGLLSVDGGDRPKAFGAGFRSAPQSMRSRRLLSAELHLNAESTDTKNERGGHLVLIVGMCPAEAGDYQLFIHDPGSEISKGGQNLPVGSSIFESHFSGNIIVFENPKS